VHAQTAAALVLALASTTLTNIAYLREHDAAVALPPLSLRRPLQSVRALLTDRSWLLGFALESSGFALYVFALALAPLSLVQSVAAGGIGILAYVSARMSRRRLGRHETAGVLVSMLGLLALAVSLSRGTGEGTGGTTAEIVLWLGATAGAAVVALTLGRRLGVLAVAEGVAGGLLFSIGDISVKVATQGGARTLLAVGVVVTELGASAETVWREVLDHRELRGYARAALATLPDGDAAAAWQPGLEPDEDLAWMITDALAAEGWDDLSDDAGHEPGILAQRLGETIPARQELVAFELIARVPHPAAADVLTVIGRHHPDKKIAKLARKAAYKAATRQAARRH